MRSRFWLDSKRTQRREVFLGSKNRLRMETLERRELLAAEILSGPRQDFWTPLNELPVPQSGQISYLNPSRFSAWSIERSALVSSLASAPLEFTSQAETNPHVFQIPTPDGNFSSFSLYVAPIMEPALAAEFPQIQTYRGQGIDDPAATLRMSVSPYGFHAQVLAPSGSYYIDPYWHQSDLAYISYFKRDLTPREDQLRPRAVLEQDDKPFEGVKQTPSKDRLDIDRSNSDPIGATKGDSVNGGTESKPSESPLMGRAGAQLRTYRLANAATGEYTQFHGGTVTAGQAAIVTTINRVVGIYEKELAIRMVLVANNSALVYTDPNTDPYSNSDSSALLSQNQTTTDNVIGNANYDVGHVFNTGGGGLAALGVVGVTGQKARGQTGSGAPVGDPFDVDYVAHELGHQFGGRHTFNGTGGGCGSNRSSVAAFEPGSGSTIMAYAGLCGADNLQTFSDPYFHSYSFDEIVQLSSSGAANAAATITNTGNSVPRVYAGRDYVIPAGTPFRLEAVSTDADTGNVLTYNWEQRDLGAAQALSAGDNGSSPLFRSWNPTTDPTRTFPRLANLLNNTTPTGERLPTTNRTLNFRAVVRDNFGGGGGVNTDDMRITVVNTGTPFAVTSPNTAVSYAAETQQTITWNVGGTTSATIGVSEVDIWLSLDGGLSFPVLLAGSTANDGSEVVTMPDVATNAARIKVAARGSIFFDVSNTNFSITSSSNTAPTISPFKNVWIPWNTSTAQIPFQVGDGQTPSANLVVSAFAADPMLVPASRIQISGTGADRTIQVRPALGQFGDTQIFVGVTDADGVTSYQQFTIYVEPSFTCQPWQGFDAVTPPSLPAGWSSTSTSGSNSWTTSATTSHSGPNNAFIPNVQSVSDTQLISPAFTATSANSQIRFQNSYNLESSFDGGVLEISVDGGSFTDLLAAGGQFLAGGYVGTLSTLYSNPIGGRAAWTGNSSGYRETTVQLPDSTLGRQVRLRWRLGTDSSVSAPGWRVDTIEQCGFAVPPIISLEATDSVKNEGNSGLTSYVFTVTRHGDLSSQVTVNYQVAGFGQFMADANDFESGFPAGTVTIPVNATSAVLEIAVRGDSQVEPDEGFSVNISTVTTGVLIDTAQALGLIVNDDQPAQPPTDILLSSQNVNENSSLQTLVGILTSQDVDPNDTHTYTFASGAGDNDNASFSIVGNQLRTNASVDFETKSNYSIRLRSTDSSNLFFEKAFAIQVIDLAEVNQVVVGDGTVQRSRVDQLIVQFDGQVVIGEGAFAVNRRGTGGGPVNVAFSAALDGQGRTIATLIFSGSLTRGNGALVDGNYELLIDASKVTRNGTNLDGNRDGSGGGNYSFGTAAADSFFALFGDINGDRSIGFADFIGFRNAFGRSVGDSSYNRLFDFDDDQVIGFADFIQFRSRFGTTLLF